MEYIIETDNLTKKYSKNKKIFLTDRKTYDNMVKLSQRKPKSTDSKKVSKPVRR